MKALFTGLIFFGKVMGYLLGFASTFVLARFYGPEILGQYRLVMVTVNMLTIFTVFGFPNGLAKYVARYRANGQCLYRGQ